MKQKETKVYFLQLIEIAFSLIASSIPIASTIVSLVNEKYIFLLLSALTFLIAILVIIFRDKISKNILVFFMNKTAPQQELQNSIKSFRI